MYKYLRGLERSFLAIYHISGHFQPNGGHVLTLLKMVKIVILAKTSIFNSSAGIDRTHKIWPEMDT